MLCAVGQWTSNAIPFAKCEGGSSIRAFSHLAGTPSLPGIRKSRHISGVPPVAQIRPYSSRRTPSILSCRSQISQKAPLLFKDLSRTGLQPDSSFRTWTSIPLHCRQVNPRKARLLVSKLGLDPWKTSTQTGARRDPALGSPLKASQLSASKSAASSAGLQTSKPPGPNVQNPKPSASEASTSSKIPTPTAASPSTGSPSSPTPNPSTPMPSARAEPRKPSGSLLGAVALITGTSVGAGILALPGISAPTGFVPATSIMVACWGFLVGEALLLAEVNVELLKEVAGETNRASDVLSLRTMAQKTLGPAGGTAATLAYVFLTYTLLTAYVAKSADVLSLLLGLPTEWSGVAFVGFFGTFLLLGGTIFTDYVNQAATATMVTLFLVMVGGGSLFADWSILEQADWSLAPAAIPIIFLSLVYHDLTPVLCSYLDGDIKRIRQAIIGGSLVPLLMFISCNAVALAISPVTGGGDPLNIMIRLGGPGPAALIESFSLLAISTSFIGTILGATEFALEQLGGLQFGMGSTPLPEASVEFAAAKSVNRVNGSARKTSARKRSGLEGGSGLTALDLVAAEGSVQEEIDRLQNRVKEKLLQWDSRFEQDGEAGNGRHSDMYSVNNGVEQLTSVLDNLEGDVQIRGNPCDVKNLAGSSKVNNSAWSSKVAASTIGIKGQVRNMVSKDSAASIGVLRTDSTLELENGRPIRTASSKEPDGPDGGLWNKEAPQTGRVNWALRTGAFFLVLVPPVAVASQYPDAFFQASNIAGAYGMTTLYGVFPVAMAWSMRSSVKRKAGKSDKYKDYKRLVPGGRFTLVLMGLCAAGIMGGQAMLDSKLAADAINDALTQAGPAAEMLQIAAAQATTALLDLARHVQTWQGGSDALETAVHSLVDLEEVSAERFAEFSTMFEGLKLGDSVNNMLDFGREAIAGFKVELR